MTEFKAYTGCDYASLYCSRVRERIAEEIQPFSREEEFKKEIVKVQSKDRKSRRECKRCCGCA